MAPTLQKFIKDLHLKINQKNNQNNNKNKNSFQNRLKHNLYNLKLYLKITKPRASNKIIYKDDYSITTFEKGHVYVTRSFKPNNQFYQWIKDNRIQLMPSNVIDPHRTFDNNGYYYDQKYDVPHTNIKTLLFIYTYFCNCSVSNKYCSTFNQYGSDYERVIIP